MNIVTLQTHIQETSIKELAQEAQNIDQSTQMLHLFVESVRAATSRSQYIDTMEKIIVVLPTELMQTEDAQTLIHWLEEDGRFANVDALKEFIFNSATTGNLPLLRKVITCYDERVEAGSAVRLRNNQLQFETPLLVACQHDQNAVAQELLAQGADVNAMDSIHSTALHTACMKLNPELVQSLINGGAYVNTKNLLGNTPLHLTFPLEYNIPRPPNGSGLYRTNRVTVRREAYQDSFVIALALINGNASFFEKDNFGRLPLDNANPQLILGLRRELSYMRLDLLNFVSYFTNGSDAEMGPRINDWKTRGHYNELRQAAYQMPSLVPILERFGIPPYLQEQN